MFCFKTINLNFERPCGFPKNFFSSNMTLRTTFDAWAVVLQAESVAKVSIPTFYFCGQPFLNVIGCPVTSPPLFQQMDLLLQPFTTTVRISLPNSLVYFIESFYKLSSANFLAVWTVILQNYFPVFQIRFCLIPKCYTPLPWHFHSVCRKEQRMLLRWRYNLHESGMIFPS